MQYARDVVSGKIPACKWVKLACARQLDDLARAGDKDFPYKFDKEKAEKLCNFAELLPHIKGPKARTPIVLEGWEEFIFCCVFGWLRKANGLRRFRRVYIEIPRGNAKSTISSIIGLFTVAADGEGGAEVYSAATTRDQAKIVFNTAQQMARNCEGYRRKFGVHVNAHNISQLASASKFEALSAEANTLDGLNVHVGIVDELHAHRTREVYDVLETGTAKREQSLLWSITTAGSNRAGICYEIRTYLTKVLDKAVIDDSFFGVIYTIDDDDDPFAEASWKKANPNWGISVMPEVVAQLAHKAMQMPSAQNNFKTKHLNVWVNADHAWMDMRAWERCADPQLSEDDFADANCVLGMDLARKVDIAAKAKLFWKDIESNGAKARHYYAFLTYYLPESAVENARNSQYAGWEASGLLTVTPGDETDYGRIADDIMLDAQQYKVREIAYDPWQAPPMIQAMQARPDWNQSIALVVMKPSVENYSPAMKELEGAIMGGRFHHNGDLPLTWMISNVVCHSDHKGNIYPRKEREENKIDAVVAVLSAMARAQVLDTDRSVYANRGVRTIEW